MNEECGTIHDSDGKTAGFAVRYSAVCSPSVPHPSLRNEWGTPSVGGTISFVDWTPGNTFVGGVDANYGFHAVAFDSDGSSDDYPDIFLGTRWEADLFFENVAANEQVEELLPGGVLPKIIDRTPVAVKGTFATNPDTDVYVTDPDESFGIAGTQEFTVSVVFNPPNTCTEAILKVEQRNGIAWEQIAFKLRNPPSEISFQFDEVSADQLRFTMTGTGCQSSDPYYLEVLARTDNP